ncbi:predicted protein [Aspergillus terreus NIH2624]|uniref:hAT-like transposase RNase-H fold domain-containing protein n=1 Tax=Aspergillus terreus (strain NIH 2624 / FGSC A1156) TaxID=341663 RepID=Q0CCK0_ASPTN|nr:uncharacterized protein ATEG_08584 [Aspergillus terreus NIH2624]EAU30716.1 predicted protein [Aspergillus terreus NIH2624]
MSSKNFSFLSSSVHAINEALLFIMAHQSYPLDLCSQDTIAPSSSISQVFTDGDNQTEVNTCSIFSPPPELDSLRLSKGRKIIQYPTEQEKIHIFEEWWNTTTWAEKRREAKKPLVRFNPKRHSSVWDKFHEGAQFPDGTPYVFCVSCSHLLQHPSTEHTGTSSMAYHVRKGCPKKSSSVPSKRTVAQMLSEKPGPTTIYTEQEFLDQVLRFIVACRLPFRTVEHVQFKRMINLAAAGSSRRPHIPNRKQIQERLIELSDEIHTQLLSRFPATGRMSIALDCWTSPDQKAFLALTGYFLTDDLDYHEIILGFRPVSGSHTGETLAAIVLSVLHKHNLCHRLLGVTTDNASNNSTMFSSLTEQLRDELDTNIQIQDTIADPELSKILRNQHHIPCLAHVIQLCVTSFMNKLRIAAENDTVSYIWENSDETLKASGSISRAIEKIRKITKFVNASPQRRERFQLTQRLESGSVYYLLLDCKTRWNSSYLMIRRALKLRQPIESFIQHWDSQKLDYLRPTPVEWKQLEYLLELLYPFYIFTSCLSENTGPTVHRVYDIYNDLFDHLDLAINRLRNKRASWKQQILEGLEEAHKKLRKYYRRTYQAEGYIYAIATILDPTSKLEKFKTATWLDDDTDWYQKYRTVFEKVFHFYRSQNPSVNTPSTVSDPLSGLNKAFYHLSKRRRLATSSETFEELKAYLDIEAPEISVTIAGVGYIPILLRRLCCRCVPIALPSSEEYQQILDEVDPDSIVFVHKEEDDDTTEAPLYISDNEDMDDMDEDPEDGLLPEPPHTTRTVKETRSLRHHERRPGQYKE